MEPRYNEVLRDWQNVFVTAGVRYIGGSLYRGFVISGIRYIGGSLYRGFVISGFIYYYWAEEYRSLYRGLRYIGVHFIGVPLYQSSIIAYRIYNEGSTSLPSWNHHVRQCGM